MSVRWSVNVVLMVTLMSLLVGCGGEPSGVGDAANNGANNEVNNEVNNDPDDGANNEVNNDPNNGMRGVGEPCNESSECATGYCVHAGNAEGICTTLCNGECSQDGFSCQILVDPQGERVSVCYPEDNRSCTPCELNSDCGGDGGNACIDQTDGLHCALRCEDGDLCPLGYTCQPYSIPSNDALRVCVLTDSLCTECFGVDFMTDVNNCGFCGNVCEIENGSAVCVEGFCEVDECDEGFADCDTFPTTGCETDLTDTCGACAALDGVPGEVCGTCDTGVWTCNGEDEVICAGDQEFDALNACGGCGELAEEPGEACGPCGLDVYECSGEDTVACSGSTFNVCGGCSELVGDIGDACGTCGTGELVCDGLELECDNDLGELGTNACGGCAVLTNQPGEQCDDCINDRYVCDGEDAVRCELNSLVDPLPGTEISGEQSGALTLAGSPYVVTSTVTVPEGQTLSIEPGVIVKIAVERRASVTPHEFLVEGTLLADGTVEEPIIFTSLHDDCHGGDTNGDGQITEAASGDWGRLHLINSGESVLRHVRVYYGGNGNLNGRVGQRAADGALMVSGERAPEVLESLEAAFNRGRGAYFNVTGGFPWSVNGGAFFSNGDGDDVPFRNAAQERGVEIVGARARVELRDLNIRDNRGDGIAVTSEQSITATRLFIQDNGGDGARFDTQRRLELGTSRIQNHPESRALLVLQASDESRVRDNQFSASLNVSPRERDILASVPPALVDEVVTYNVLERAERGVEVRAGELARDAVWPSGVTYVPLGTVTVAESGSLILESGVLLKFDPSAQSNVDPGLLVEGRLEVLGSAEEPVILTSLLDDVGGDTNGDGVNSEPSPGDWGVFEFKPGSRGRLESVKVLYGGGEGRNERGAEASLIVQNSDEAPLLSDVEVGFSQSMGVSLNLPTGIPWTATDLFVHDCVVTNVPQASRRALSVRCGAGDCTLDGLRVEDTTTVPPGVATIGVTIDAEGGVVLNDATVVNNGVQGVQVSQASELTMSGVTIEAHSGYGLFVNDVVEVVEVDAVTVQDNGLIALLTPDVVEAVLQGATLEGDGGIHIAEGELSGDAVWPPRMYVFQGNMTVVEGGALMLEVGTTVKFDARRSGSSQDIVIDVVGGMLQVLGTEESPIIFTSGSDDSVGGDTNQDGLNTTAQSGDWSSLRVTGGGDLVLEHVEFRYGGGLRTNSNRAGDAALVLRDFNQAPILSDVRITDSVSSGLILADQGSEAVSVARLEVARVAGSGVSLSQGLGLFSLSDFEISDALLRGIEVSRPGEVSLDDGRVEGCGVVGLEVRAASTSGSVSSVAFSNNVVGVSQAPSSCEGWTFEDLTFDGNDTDAQGCP